MAASVAWAIALPLAPFAARQPHGGTFVFGFAYGMYAIGSFICHQIPARSFHVWATPLPVCARCVGIYLGAASTAVLTLALGLKPGDPKRTLLARDVRPKPEGASASMPASAGLSSARMRLVAAAIPTAATLLYEWTTGDPPANWVRAVAGAPLGAAIAWIIREVN